MGEPLGFSWFLVVPIFWGSLRFHLACEPPVCNRDPEPIRLRPSDADAAGTCIEICVTGSSGLVRKKRGTG